MSNNETRLSVMEIQAFELKKQGKTVKEIAKQLDVSKFIVMAWLEKRGVL